LIRRLLDVSSVDWYSVQYNARPAETHGSLHSFPNASVSLTAQYMRALDLVITIDSMPAHLAGALGVPVWTLLTHHADWRWLLERKDSPWYPTMQLFRQPAPGQWAPVIDMVRHALLASPRRLPSASDTE
jgi:ADP-heptose:LPS heptosyltransferase